MHVDMLLLTNDDKKIANNRNSLLCEFQSLSTVKINQYKLVKGVYKANSRVSNTQKF